MMWAAGILASLGSITYPAISAFVSIRANVDTQGKFSIRASAFFYIELFSLNLKYICFGCVPNARRRAGAIWITLVSGRRTSRIYLGDGAYRAVSGGGVLWYFGIFID